MAAKTFSNLAFWVFQLTFIREVWTMNNETLLLIQGYPCPELSTTEIRYGTRGDYEKTAWPLECDQVCGATRGCGSFVWGRGDSSCRLYQVVRDY